MPLHRRERRGCDEEKKIKLIIFSSFPGVYKQKDILGQFVVELEKPGLLYLKDVKQEGNEMSLILNIPDEILETIKLPLE